MSWYRVLGHVMIQGVGCVTVQGVGYGMPSQRQRQFEQRKVMKAVENVFEYRTQKIMAIDNSMVTRDKKETKKCTMRSNAGSYSILFYIHYRW